MFILPFSNKVVIMAQSKEFCNINEQCLNLFRKIFAISFQSIYY